MQNDPVNFADPLGLLQQPNCPPGTRYDSTIGECVADSDLNEPPTRLKSCPADQIFNAETGTCEDRPGLPGEGPLSGDGSTFSPRRSNWLDRVQSGLDIVGCIPGIGEIADGCNAAISLCRGDYVGAGLSGAAMIPFLGWAATAGKVGRRAAAITMDQAIEQGVKHVGDGAIMEVTGAGMNFQFRNTVTNAAGQIETRVARFDVNPADPHVQRAGSHLNLELRVGKRKVGKDPHTPIDPSTVRKGDCP